MPWSWKNYPAGTLSPGSHTVVATYNPSGANSNYVSSNATITQLVQDAIRMQAAKRLGMSPCPEAIEYLYERYYEQGRTPRASDCRDLLEIVQSICRFKRQPVQLTRELIAEAASTFIAEF